MNQNRNNNWAASAAAAVLALSLLLGGCGAAANTDNTQNTQNSQSTQSSQATEAGTKSSSAETSSGSSGSSAAADSTQAASSELFTKRDLEQTADLSEAKTLTVSDGGTLKITEAGVYVLSGSAKNAQVVVEAGKEDKVQLVLDGLSITNDDKACILVESADKVFITSAEGSGNALTVSGKFSSDEDAVIFSRDDLVLNGLGSVSVTSSKDGIRSNDDLKLTGGSWTVNASNTALKAHDAISACGGTWVLTAGSDGLHAEDNDDASNGFITIEGGTFTIKAGDDAVHAVNVLTVSGGKLAITAAEGLEATQVVVSGGEVDITASDDGINAGKKNKSLAVKIEISGGSIRIVMGQGDTDGIDSNGDLIISGGTIDVTAQSPFDYDGTCSYTGGTLIVNGSETNTITNQMMGPGGQGGWGGQQGGSRPNGGGRH